MKRTWINGSALVLALMILVTACRKKDAPLPDNTVKFESTEQGIAETASSITVKILLDRAASTQSQVAIQLTTSPGLDYGADFTTNPAANSNLLTVPVLSGASEATFTVTKTSGALFYGD